jgi:hypothetical protein
MFSIILATLVTMQATPTQLYKIESVQYGMTEGYARLQIEPQNGYKWGKEYPAVLTLQTNNNKNVVLSKTRFDNRGGDFSLEGDNAYVDIPFEVKDHKEHVITGTITFLLCNKERCIPQRNIKVQIVLVGEVGC